MKFYKSIERNTKFITRRLIGFFENPYVCLRVVIFASISLMLLGFADELVHYGLVLPPGPSISTQSGLWHNSTVPVSILVMSAGILLFTFIPGLRVLFGLEKFIRRKETINEIAALVVITELFISIFV